MGAILDKSIYFTISFSGKTLTNYGVKSSNPLYVDAVISCQNYSASTVTNNGVITTTINATILPVSSLYSVYGITDGQVDAGFILSKTGTVLGSYQIEPYVGVGYITDQTVPGKTLYYLSTTGFVWTVTSATTTNIKGTFSCNLISGSTLIPATGSFSLSTN